MPRRRALPAPKRRRSKKLPFIALSASIALIGICVIALLRYAERSIAPLLSGMPRPDYTTKVYAAPLSIHPGLSLERNSLVARLERLGYWRVLHDPEKGEYRVNPDMIEIHLRPFTRPGAPAAAKKIAVAFSSGSVSSLGSAEGPLTETALEPELLYELSGEKRVRRSPLKDSDIPQAMINALVAIEDRRFFEHQGVDGRGILRAAWRNLRKRRIAEGGSTLTQQLAKNLFLTPKRTFSRKFKEALLAFYLEARYSKRELLRLYLDTVYFGQHGSVAVMGLSEAARHFFAKEPSELSPAQCALLAGLLRSPAGYDPFRHPARALARRSDVLAAMEKEGFLKAEERRSAAEEPLGLLDAPREQGKEADFVLGYLRRLLSARTSDELWMTRGMTVYTTIDPWLQEKAAAAVETAKHEAALIALDPANGAIRALVGGRDYSNAPFDRATLAMRQPGSAFKPFVYGAALRKIRNKSRLTAASIINDESKVYSVEGGTWSPKNFDGRTRGRVSLRAALSLSLNAATISLLSEIGPESVVEFAREMGVRSPLQPTLSLGLGSYETTLLELVGAYAPFANGGSRVSPYLIEAALDAEGGIVEFHQPFSAPVLSRAESFMVTDLLRETARSGTARSLARWGLEKISAGKTGTSDEGKDAWFIGYTPRILAGVWTGSDIPKSLGLSGSADALPIWAEFVSSAFPEALGPSWEMPGEIIEAEIDPLSGFKPKSGCPERRIEIFLPGSAPEESCPLHSGGPIGWFKRVFSSKGR